MSRKPFVIPALALLVVLCGGGALLWTLASQRAQEARSVGASLDPAAAREAVRRNPDDAGAHLALAEHYAAEPDHAAAARELQEVLRIQPGNRKAAFMLALIQRKSGHLADARRIYKDLARTDDDWGAAAKRNLKKLAPESSR